MRIYYTQLEKLPVDTVSGISLGKVTDLVCDSETYTIVQIIVTSGMIKTQEYHIHPRQIVSIRRDTIIVEDAAFQSRETSTAQFPTQGTSPAMMREEA